ncbi:MAG: NAD-dependent epimerase/dehydratase family protein [Hyphomicrobiaceae bacterium]|nr:NAD-dependent epimerase/dehydratase family protein [Hyphomicrobiaceae bacterium]
MPQRVLITGGGGFIGRNLTRALIERGATVRILDNLHEQVHGRSAGRHRLGSDGEVVIGDIRDASVARRALVGVDKVVHLAAEVGVGQSMYAVERYVSTNDCGTAVLMEALIGNPVERIVVASSMSIYGEGLYRDADGKLIEDMPTRAGRGDGSSGWDPRDGQGRPLVPVPTPESKRPSLASVYALTKYAQERLVLLMAAAYGMQAVALRLFNVYGPGQALSNPYTGVLAIFASRLLNGRSPLIFEDGRQRRDFVHVDDVSRAFTLALEHPAAAGNVYNVGSGRHRSIREVADMLAAAMGRDDIVPEIAGKARAGDIRHCFADVEKIRAELGFTATSDFAHGLAGLARWVASQEAQDRVPKAREELEQRGLVA